MTDLGHDHVFLGPNHRRNERRVWLVIALTAAMMVTEIVTGTLYGSMALVADGWHMATHAGAMLIAALAYLYARRHARNPRFSFGTGKLGDLAGFAGAVVLALIALLIGWESAVRLVEPIPIHFGQAIGIAALGLVVNLASAWLLREDHDHHHHHHHHHHDQSHHHDQPQAAGARDNNLRAAYLHVLADALTSVLAIVALALGWLYGWRWPDPVMGVVGALVIARWSWGLIRDAGAVLLDVVPRDKDRPRAIQTALERDGDRITDLHVWQVGPGQHAAIVSVLSDRPAPPSVYKSRLAHLDDLAHVTVEVEALSGHPS